MAILPIIHAPHPIFKQKMKHVGVVNDLVQELAQDMLDTMYAEGAIGLGANMVGIDQRIIVLDLRDEGSKPYVMINPEIVQKSAEISEFEEASVSFPGISAVIKRPNKIKVKYLDINGEMQTLEAEGFLARVILHEADYLDGVVYLDYLSKMKKDMLMDKMTKFIKHNPPHVHGPHCKH